MATIRASCPDCGDVELTTEEMTVRVCLDDQRGAYTFRCPACAMTVHKDAEPRIVDLLVSSGVQRITWRLPLELGEHPTGLPLTHDDLIEFHDLLADDGWFATLSAMVQG